MACKRRWNLVWAWAFALLCASLLHLAVAQELDEHHLPLSSYHYGAKITVECLKRSM
jgi:hypothetical protein